MSSQRSLRNRPRIKESLRDDHLALLKAEHAILALIDAETRLEVVLERIAREIERHATASCAIIVPAIEGGVLHVAAAPTLSESHRQALDQALARSQTESSGHSGAMPSKALADLDGLSRRVIDAQARANGLLVDRYYPLTARNSHFLGTIVLYRPTGSDDSGGTSASVQALSRLARIAIETDRSIAALRSADERFAALAASVPGVVYQRRVGPDGDIRYTYISEGARDLFGVSAEEILADPKALFDCHGPSYRESFRQRLLEASRDLTIWDVEAEIISRDGKRKWTHAIARPKRLPDGAVLWDGIILDATRIARREQELRAAMEQAELANRGKSEFLASMSHELRTPLNAIIGFSQMMHEGLLGPLGSPQYQEYCRDILESGRHLLSIINDVLDISKVEAGKIQLNEDNVDIAVVVPSVIRLMRERSEKAGVTVSAELADGLPDLYGDERLVKQILANLLSNAIKFTPKDGKAVIRARLSDDRSIVLSVEDNGIGIAPQDIPRAMERFGQIDSSLSRRFEGTGLGLPLVKAFAELHGGTLEIQSQPDVGTKAIVRFPPGRTVQEQREPTKVRSAS